MTVKHITDHVTLTAPPGEELPERIDRLSPYPFGDRYYLIRNGMYYRPDSKGYTSSMMEAGLFGEEYAREVCAETEGVTMEMAI